MTNEYEIQEDVAGLMAELTANSQAATLAASAQRDPSVPVGAVVAESDIDGAGVVREVKHGSMVRHGNTPLPERFEAWDLYGRSSQLPTGQMTYFLSKPNAEHKDRKAFHLHRNGVTRESCTICPPAKAPYEGTCMWCSERSLGQVTKVFESEDARDSHHRAFHEKQWETFERRIERELQREQMALQRAQAEAMTAIAQQLAGTSTGVSTGLETPTVPSPTVQVLAESAAPSEPAVTKTAKRTWKPVTCKQCGEVFDMAIRLARHTRDKHPRS